VKSKVALDASAIIALLNGETGADIVAEHLDAAIISSVNYCEVASYMMGMDIDAQALDSVLAPTLPNIINFNIEQATLAAALRKDTKKFGLSLGDRACLALGLYENCKVITADTAWSKLKLTVEVIQIR
jgi:ribonuclease VapC